MDPFDSASSCALILSENPLKTLRSLCLTLSQSFPTLETQQLLIPRQRVPMKQLETFQGDLIIPQSCPSAHHTHRHEATY